MNKINIALLGCGVVGGGTYDILLAKNEEYKAVFGLDIQVKKILVKDLSERRMDIDKSLFTEDFNDIVNDDSISIVVEVMGTIDIARNFTLKALKAKKSVVSANKDLIALSFAEILSTAKDNNVIFAYEASVAGAIPVIGPINRSLVGKTFSKVVGILNGTTNYMLTKMTYAGMTYEEALKEATDLGYAEAVPDSDVLGYDAARKIAILSSLCFKREITFNDVITQGITEITKDDIEYATETGYVIKLLGVGEEVNGKIVARVNPMLVPHEHPLANVNDSYNAIYLNSDYGDTMLYGRGAGDLPTGSAVVGDIVQCARNINSPIECKDYSPCYRNIEIGTLDDIFSKYFIKIKTNNTVGTLAKIASSLGDFNISIEKITQKYVSKNIVNVYIMTEAASNGDLDNAISSIKNLNITKDSILTLGVL